MTKLVRRCPTASSLQKGAEGSKRYPQQEDQPDATEGEDITEYNPEVDYEGSEPKVKQSAQEQREVDPDAEYVKMDIA